MLDLLFENVFVFQDEDGAWHLSYEYGISRRILPLGEIHAAQQGVQPTGGESTAHQFLSPADSNSSAKVIRPSTSG